MARKSAKAAAGPCGVGDAVETIASGWRGEILWFLSTGPQRFMALRRLIPDISPKVLTQALRGLERDGLISREQFASIPPQVVYSLTALGRSSAPVLEAVASWWKKHGDAIRAARADA